jgi:predicted DNA binding CopG/RHH family protein
MNKLQNDEREILKSVENDEWNNATNLDTEKKKYKKYAQATFRKDKRINIRISERDLESLQMKALEEGLPYQTLISSILHKFINGKLVRK